MNPLPYKMFIGQPPMMMVYIDHINTFHWWPCHILLIMQRDTPWTKSERPCTCACLYRLYFCFLSACLRVSQRHQPINSKCLTLSTIPHEQSMYITVFISTTSSPASIATIQYIAILDMSRLIRVRLIAYDLQLSYISRPSSCKWRIY